MTQVQGLAFLFHLNFRNRHYFQTIHLKLLLKIRAKESGVAAKLIARSDDLEALAAGVRKNLNILSGWRFEQFGRDALDLVEGRLAFAIENGKLKMSRVVTEAEETVDA